MKRVTMAQVARRAGVSRSAVSAAFSDRVTTVGLNPKTRQQIKKAAEELGYKPNILSLSFIKQRSYLIGLLATENFFLFTLETIKGLEDVLESTDYSLLAFYHGSTAAEQAKHLQKALSRRVDGLIVVGAPEPADGPNHRQIKQLREAGVPVVQIHRKAFPDVPTVMMDETQSSYVAVKHLLELGHRRIAHVTYSEYRDTSTPGEHAEARQRCDGYLQAMKEAGLPTKVFTFDRSTYFGLGSNDYSGFCRKPAEELAASSPRFTAVTTFNDYAAIGLIHNFNALGLRAPDDISIVGYDNAEAGMLMRPALTTLAPKLFEIGRLAGRMILDMMEGKAVSDVLLPPDLVIRESTSRPAQ